MAAKPRAIAPSEVALTARRSTAPTVIEVLQPGDGMIPVRSRQHLTGDAAANRLADLLTVLVAHSRTPIVELNFRKALEALAPASVRARAADLADYAVFCDATGRIGLPASEATVVAWVEQLGADGLKPATVARRLSSLASAHGLLGVASPTNAPVVRHALKVVKKRAGVAQRQALGLRFGDGDAPSAGLTFSAMLTACETDCQGLRNAALLSLGYDAGLRVSELVAVAVEHLETDADDSGLLFIPRAKTDQDGEGAYAWLSADTMRRVAAWQLASGIVEGVLFRRIAIVRRDAVTAQPARVVADLAPNAHIDWLRMRAQRAQPALVRYTIGETPLTGQGVNMIYRSMARRTADLGLVGLSGADLDAAVAALSTHSLRVGLAQDLFAAGEDVGPIAQALRWKSTTTALRYARKLAPKVNAAARVLSKVRK
jgi:site-specific recombinase XerD